MRGVPKTDFPEFPAALSLVPLLTLDELLAKLSEG
jgi:hypothetical protein